MKIKTNVVFEHLLETDKKISIEQGGTRSGKTYNILLYIIFHYSLKNTGKTITICRKTFPSVRASVMRDFFDILKIHNCYLEANHNKSNHEYKTKWKSNRIYFFRPTTKGKRKKKKLTIYK